MARKVIDRLTARKVASINAPGYHADGLGLYLQVSGSGTKSWVLRYKINGRAREMGLGPLSAFTLAEARERAAQQRKLIADKIDPIDARREQRAADRVAAARTMTFAEAAKQYIAAHEAGWRNAKHADQWRNTIATYAEPILGKLPVAEIDTGLVLSAIEPIWRTKTETASRVRGRIAAILDWAKVHNYRTGDNPARWRGHLDKLLAKPRNVARPQHHPALPYAEIGKFMADLRKAPGVAALAVEFIILTAARTSEALRARWSEIDLDAKRWVVPADRMKAGREHRVPLSEPALEVLQKARALPGADLSPTGWVFPGAQAGAPLSNMAGLALLRRLKRGELTVHGFRTTFRDWIREETHFPRDVAETAIAHAIKDDTEAAYLRGDLFDKRVGLMAAWGAYCGKTHSTGSVVPLRARK